MAHPIIAAPVDNAAAAQAWLEGLDRAARRSETPCGEHEMLDQALLEARIGLLQEARPYAEVAVVPGAGHWLFYEASDRLNETFGKFFTE